MKPVQVLVVDDDRTSRMILRALLEGRGYAVDEADSGEVALERFRSRIPDVVFLDVLMPGIDGIETARQMKQIAGATYVPIIMLTALADVEMLARALEAGADDYLSKPFNRTVLEARLRAALRARALFGELHQRNERLRDLGLQSDREQDTAARLLAGMLHSETLECSGLRYRSTPLERFNGDLLMAERTPGGAFRMLLGDFAGHGLAAAIGALPIVEAFQVGTRRGDPVERLLKAANTNLRSILPRDLFLAACVIELDPERQRASVWNAGMPPVLIRGRTGGIKAEAPSRMIPLGVLGQLPFKAVVIDELEPGDRIYLFSDGFIEGLDPFQNEFGEATLRQLVARENEGGSRFDAILAAQEAHVDGTPLTDDTTLVEITYTPELFLVPEAPTQVGRAVFELGAALLPASDPMVLLEAWLESLPSLAGARSTVATIMTELLTNAVDHGLLRLDSRLKSGPGGFGAYYEERERRLASLLRGQVRFELVVEQLGPTSRLTILVEDSGPGFNFGARADGVDSKPFGRGLSLVRALCKEFNIVNPGNRVEAVYEWSAAGVEALARPA